VVALDAVNETDVTNETGHAKRNGYARGDHKGSPYGRFPNDKTIT